MSLPSHNRQEKSRTQPVSHRVRSHAHWRWASVAVVAALIAAGILLLLWRNRSAIPQPPPATAASTTMANVATTLDRYAGSESCRECHQTEYDRWSKSHHGLAERPIDPSLDKPAFDPPRDIHHGTQVSRAEIRDNQFQVVTAGLSGKKEAVVAKRVIGVDPLRQFLVDGPRGRMQALELAYDPDAKNWFDVYGNEDRQPGEWGHWTGRGMTWNSMCAACHNTRLLKNYDEPSDSYQTRMAELSVGCEACHGPMKQHVAQERKTREGGAKPASTAPAGSPAYSGLRFSREQVFDTCGTCHARRGDITGDFVPGDSFFNHYSLSGVDETETFYPDGQVREEDYELSAFLGSKMHAVGVRCVDCHDVHSGKTLLDGNALCMKCHIGAYPKAPIINPLAHTFHAPASAGSQCVNCHMPQTKYMQRHGRHDHGFTIPDPLLTKLASVPNACNRCHTDKDADWAIAATNKWYGAKMDRPTRSRALAVASARKGEDSARPALLSLLGNPQEPAYWKAGFVRLLARWENDPAVAAALAAQLHDSSPMVREAAVTVLASLPEPDAALRTQIEGLLTDVSRSVRVAAAHALGPAVNPSHPAAQELLACLEYQADQPAGQFQLALRDATLHAPDAAIAHLKRMVEWDPRSATLRREAAVLYGNLGKPEMALAQISEACRLEPGNADYAFLHGLAASEAGKSAEAIEAMEKAVQLDPHSARAWYNLALMEQNAGKAAAALNAFQNAEAADPTDPRIPYGRAVLLAQQNQLPAARAAAQRAMQIAPGYRDAIELLRSLPQ